MAHYRHCHATFWRDVMNSLLRKLQCGLREARAGSRPSPLAQNVAEARGLIQQAFISKACPFYKRASRIDLRRPEHLYSRSLGCKESRSSTVNGSGAPPACQKHPACGRTSLLPLNCPQDAILLSAPQVYVNTGVSQQFSLTAFEHSGNVLTG